MVRQFSFATCTIGWKKGLIPMLRLVLSLILPVIVLLALGYEFYRTFFKIDGFRKDYHSRIDWMPKGSAGRIFQEYLIDSTSGLWLLRGIMLFGIVLSVTVIEIVIRDCHCQF